MKETSNNEKQATWKHVVDKESGSRGGYPTVSDESTKYGTGQWEMIIRADGYSDMANSRHWKKGSRPQGYRPDKAQQMANLSQLELRGTDAFEVMAMDGGSEKNQKALVKLSNDYYSKIAKPEMHSLQSLRKNPTARKARKTKETIMNQITFYEEEPEQLTALIEKENDGFLSMLEGQSRVDAVKALETKFMNDRKGYLKKK
jgi:hypothetical protein|tara:strand:- start:137 stop:742 length:606 start_codon:yes stop_codon:yes gene_type:complete